MLKGNTMFLTNKYTNYYYGIINRAKCQSRIKSKETYFEAHHIIPECLGGVETVLLTAKEHFICHWLLTKMFDDHRKYKMFKAFSKMYIGHKNSRYKPSFAYELAKKMNAEATSFFQKGRSKPVGFSEKCRKIRTGQKWSEKTKQKISDNHADVTGENNPMFGKTHSQITKEKMSAKAKENNKGQKNPMFGKNHSEETKEKIKQSWIRRKAAKQLSSTISFT